MKVGVWFMSSKVSVIVPCYNSKRAIARALGSLEKQTFKDFETIVVDDASTDGSLEIINSFGVKVIGLKKNSGVSFCRNRAVEAASGNLLLFMDADCWAEPNWVKKMVDAVRRPEVDAVAGKIKIPNSTAFGNAVAELGFPGGGNAGFENMWPVSDDGFTAHASSCNLGLKKEMFEKIRGFDEELRRGQDAFLSFVLSKNNVKIKYVPEAIVFHEPMTSFKRFVYGHIMRGKANYQFKKRVRNIKSFVFIRFWSSKNILKNNLFKPRLPLVFSLLFLSFVLQQVGFVREKLQQRARHSKQFKDIPISCK